MANQIHPTSTKRPKLFYGYVIAASLFFIMLVMGGSNIAFGIFFKPVSEQFDWSRAATSGAFSLSFIISGFLGVVMGSLNDKFGPRVVMTVCGAVMGAGFLLMSQINSLWQLYFFYGLIIGIGAGGTYVPPLSTVARWFTTRRSLMSGIVLIGFSLGSLVTPPFSNWIIGAYNWRNSYLIIGGIVLIVVVVASQFLKRDPSKMGLRPYGENNDQVKKAEITGFSLRDALHTPQFWIVVAMEFIFGILLFTIVVHLVPHVSDLGISATTAAGVLALAGGGSIIGRVVLGPAGDRIGNRNIFIIGFFIIAADLFWLMTIKDIGLLYVFAAFFGFAYGGMESSESPIVAWLFGIKSHGLIFGVLSLAFTLGAGLGPFIAGYIFDISASYRLDFLIMAILGIIGIILTFTLRPIPVEKDSSDSKIPSPLSLDGRELR